MKLVTFRIHHERYALALDFVHSIEKWQPIRPVPHAPLHIVGIMNLRGVVMTVADLRSILAAESEEVTGDTRLLVVGSTAYIVDEALDVLDVADEQIELRNSSSDMIYGILQDEAGLIIVLDQNMVSDEFVAPTSSAK